VAELNGVPATISVPAPENGLLLITMGGEYDIGVLNP
jgi:hypothetical protein